MKKKNFGFKYILNKIAAKRFSNNEKIAIAVISCALIISTYYYLTQWANSFKKTLKVVAPLTPPLKTPTTAETKEVEKKVEKKAEEVKTFNIRDPFLSSNDVDSVVVEKNPAFDLKLKGILWDDQIPTAIINSKVVKIGDLISNKTVVDIEKDKVILMEDGEVYLLKLRTNK